MKSKTLEHLQFFVGKVCSIISTSMNRSFDEKISREHFVVLVESIDSDGIWGTHPYNKDLVSFFSLEHIISIHQEEVLDPTNPEHAAMISEFEKRTGKKVQADIRKPEVTKPEVKKTTALPVLKEAPPVPLSTGDATFVDIDSLERLAENTRRAFHEHDKFDLRKP
jgi:hypothetical protein